MRATRSVHLILLDYLIYFNIRETCYSKTRKLLKVEALWVMTLCSVVVGYQRFFHPEDGGSMNL